MTTSTSRAATSRAAPSPAAANAVAPDAVAPNAVAPNAVAAVPVRRRRSRRWLRAVVPFAILLALWMVSLVAHAAEEPDLNEAGTLSPTGTGAHGSSRLAELLADRGLRVERVTSSLEALQAAATGDATILVPAPDYISPTFARFAAIVPGAHRIVIVQPGLRTLFGSGLPILYAGERWATATVAPRCSTPFAMDAGPAAALHDRYLYDPLFDDDPALIADCYAGGVVGVREKETETVFVGATDPFRNDRIGEDGNAALALGLLGAYERVIWLDVHAREPIARSPAGLPNPALPEYRRDDRARGATGDPTIDAFPPALWAALLLGLGAAVLLAFARGRRLGPPVSEPLPVLVPSAESVTGRGRLYNRIRARQATLDALRASAIGRIARVLNPFGGPAPERDLIGGPNGPPLAAEAFLQQISARTGVPDHFVRTILYGPAPDDDDSLARAVADVDRLVQAVRGETTVEPPSAPSQGGTP